jgi:hypothetical protein
MATTLHKFKSWRKLINQKQFFLKKITKLQDLPSYTIKFDTRQDYKQFIPRSKIVIVT